MGADLWNVAREGLAHRSGRIGHHSLDHRPRRTPFYTREIRGCLLAWVRFVWLVPLLGAVLYLFCRKRPLRRHAACVARRPETYRAEAAVSGCSPDELHNTPWAYRPFVHAGASRGRSGEKALLRATGSSRSSNGDEAYPAMLQAVAEAKRTISFSTYIFDRDEAGLEFARAFGDAKRRGVEVRVLIDAAGTRYSFPSIMPYAPKGESALRPFFWPAFALWRMMSMNMRTHRKILVADGQVGFTGGINIRKGHCLQKNPKRPVQDLIFASKARGGDPIARSVRR